MNTKKIAAVTILTTALAGVSTPALTAELEYVLRGGVAHSDNVQRLPSGLEEGSNAAVAGLELRGSRPVGRLRYEIASDLAYYEYMEDNLDSALYGRASLTGAYDFVPEKFSWNASLAFDQLREDNFRPLAPGNLDEQLTFSTGPTLRARFSNTMEAMLDARYSRLNYSNRPFDSETVGGRAQLVRRANPRSLLALGISHDDVSYISGLGSSALDYRRQEVFGRMEIEGVRTEIQVEAGYADVSGQAVDDGGPLLRARLTRRLTPTLSASLGAITEYPTSGSTALSSDPTISGGGTYDSSVLTSAPRIATSFEGGLRMDRPRTQAELFYTYRNDESLIAGVGERDFNEIRGRVSRSFTPKAQGSLYAAKSSEDYSQFQQEFDEQLYGASLAITFGRALGLELRIEHRDRDSETPIYQYSELSGGIFLRYAGSAGGE